MGSEETKKKKGRRFASLVGDAVAVINSASGHGGEWVHISSTTGCCVPRHCCRHGRYVVAGLVGGYRRHSNIDSPAVVVSERMSWQVVLLTNSLRQTQTVVRRHKFDFGPIVVWFDVEEATRELVIVSCWYSYNSKEGRGLTRWVTK